MRDFLFTYDNICLRPEYSELPSRSLGDTSISFLGRQFNLPVIPANMKDVISWEIASNLSLNKYAYIMHRFDDANRKVPPHVTSFSELLSVSIGVNDPSKAELSAFSENGRIPDFITIDVAHGHHNKVSQMLKWVKTNCPAAKVICGNVATSEGYKFLCDIGADAVKVGIGGGSICTTRFKTGFHLPTAYSVWECSTFGERDIPIIADGGAKHFGDIAKALVLGADMVMSGRWFAECIDSPAKIHDGKKIYRGSTSFEAKGHNNHVEGQTLVISEGCTYAERLTELKQALQSSISYAGGKDLSAFNGIHWDLME